MPLQNWSESIIVVELANDPAFTDDLNALLEHLASHTSVDVVLNMAAVGYLNSSNIAKLLRVRKFMIGHGGKLRIAGISSHVWGVFLVTGLDKVFDFADNVSTALAFLQIERAGQGS